MTWRTTAIIAGAQVAVIALAFLMGRHSATPAPVATKDTVHAQSSEQSTTKSASTAHVEAIAHVEAKADTDAKTHTVIRWLPAVPAANGCPAVPAHVEQETTTETHAATDRMTDKHRASNVAAKQEQRASAQQTVVELHTVTPVRPAWSFGISGGVAREHAVPIFGPVIVGGQIGHRIAGPFSLDLSANTSPAAMLTLRIDL